MWLLGTGHMLRAMLRAQSSMLHDTGSTIPTRSRHIVPLYAL
jgi:hypothetical protein